MHHIFLQIDSWIVDKVYSPNMPRNAERASLIPSHWLTIDIIQGSKTLLLIIQFVEPGTLKDQHLDIIFLSNQKLKLMITTVSRVSLGFDNNLNLAVRCQIKRPLGFISVTSWAEPSRQICNLTWICQSIKCFRFSLESSLMRQPQMAERWQKDI